MLTLPPHHVISVKVWFQLNKTVCNTKFVFNLTRNDSQKRHILALCFFPWARVEISRVSRARRVRKQATIKFNQWFIYKLISYVQTSVKSYAKILFTTRGDLIQIFRKTIFKSNIYIQTLENENYLQNQFLQTWKLKCRVEWCWLHQPKLFVSGKNTRMHLSLECIHPSTILFG